MGRRHPDRPWNRLHVPAGKSMKEAEGASGSHVAMAAPFHARGLKAHQHREPDALSCSGRQEGSTANKYTRHADLTLTPLDARETVDAAQDKGPRVGEATEE